MKKINDLWSRAGKTAVQAFFGILIPEIVLILKNVGGYDWNKWYVWAIPIIASALSAGISAGWNALINVKNKNESN